MTDRLRIVFAGTPDFAVPALDALHAAGHEIAAVYTQPDRPAGRGQTLNESPVKRRAVELDLPLEQPATLRTAGAAADLAAYRPELMVVVAYGLILPPAILGVPRLGCWNIHASLLPRWRGAAPIQRAILAGDTTTGITIMKMDAGLVEQCLAGRLVAVQQPDEGATYAAKIRKPEAVIDWRQPSAQIDRQVRAFNPWPVAETRWQGQQLRIWEAESVAANGGGEPGRVLEAEGGRLLVAAGEGALHLHRVQLAGRRAMTPAEFLNAHPLAGARLGE